jgi:ferric-dicitrate binding protein FerR (iron transport regulator)
VPVWAAVLAIACGAPVAATPGVATPEAHATVTELHGAASFDCPRAAIHPGSTISPKQVLVLQAGATALISLPDGSTIQLGKESSPESADFFLVSLPPGPPWKISFTYHGPAQVAVLAGTTVTAFTGAAVLEPSAPATFETAVVGNANHPDVSVKVLSGSVRAGNENGFRTLQAGEQALVRAPRASDIPSTPRPSGP